jgi:hypothetical protein
MTIKPGRRLRKASIISGMVTLSLGDLWVAGKRRKERGIRKVRWIQRWSLGSKRPNPAVYSWKREVATPQISTARAILPRNSLMVIKPPGGRNRTAGGLLPVPPAGPKREGKFGAYFMYPFSL